jgi:hypothetical protein
LNPQQATLPSVFKPHVWYVPAESWLNVAIEGVDWPYALEPQQATLPSPRKPQL